MLGKAEAGASAAEVFGRDDKRRGLELGLQSLRMDGRWIL
jgi:hypothetical protein